MLSSFEIGMTYKNGLVTCFRWQFVFARHKDTHFPPAVEAITAPGPEEYPVGI